MKDFEYFVKKGDVKHPSPDKALADALIMDTKERIRDSFKMQLNDFPKSIFENMYDALRDFCDALLALEGYKSYSHEASISFLLKNGFDVAFVAQLDLFRQTINNSKYYGSKISAEEAETIKKFYEMHSGKIYKHLEEVGLV